jgi:mRNA interferase RelE/StbE
MWSAALAWRIEFEDAAVKELAKLDKPVARRILAFLRERVSQLDDPRSVGEALKGSKLGEFWKYRVGDYRIVAHIEDEALRILVLKVGNRREVYRS